MAYSVQDIYSSLESVLHGTTTNQITNLNGLIERAARKLMQDVDPNETKRILPFASPIFNDVWNYPLPVDLKGEKIIDIFPQAARNVQQVLNHSYGQAFDTTKQSWNANDFNIVFDAGNKYIRINDNFLPAPVILSPMNEITGFSITGTATNLKQNSTNFVTYSSSIQADIATGVGGVETTFTESMDLTPQYNQGSIFVWVYMPTASEFTDVIVKWGTDNANYWTRTLTVNQEGTSFINGWNLIKADWLGSTVVGAPVVTNVNYISVDATVTDNQTAVLFNSFSVTLGQIMNLSYYSKYLFRDFVTNAFQENVTDVSNIVNLDTDSFNLLLDITFYFAAQQQQGADSQTDAAFWLNQYNEDKKRYQALYKSEIQKPRTQAYIIKRGGYTDYIGRKFNY